VRCTPVRCTLVKMYAYKEKVSVNYVISGLALLIRYTPVRYAPKYVKLGLRRGRLRGMIDLI
jgi:hypothetical protein